MEGVGRGENAVLKRHLEGPPSDSDTFSDLYPERRGSKVFFSMGDYMMGRTNISAHKDSCGAYVVRCLESSPLIKLMLNALKTQGCLPDMYGRHFSCDTCAPGNGLEHLGNYDSTTNQAFICANNAKSYGQVHGTLLRQLIHMFDVCTAKIDWTNLDHLACMEVRKANLANCNFLVYFSRPESKLAFRGVHRDCVANTAIDFLTATKFVDRKSAEAAVSRVFDKCYEDLEPIGRRCNNNEDMERAYDERYLFGYL